MGLFLNNRTSRLYYTNLMWNMHRRTRHVVAALASSHNFYHRTTRNSTNKIDKLSITLTNEAAEAAVTE